MDILKLSFSLASCGVTIVSGGALGIDSEAHAGAMLAKGRTVAFLGCGLSFDYLKENASLRRAITKYGAVVSERKRFNTAPSVMPFADIPDAPYFARCVANTFLTRFTFSASSVAICFKIS